MHDDQMFTWDVKKKKKKKKTITMFLWISLSDAVVFVVINLYHSLGKFSRRQIDDTLLFFQKTEFDTS